MDNKIFEKCFMARIYSFFFFFFSFHSLVEEIFVFPS